MEVQWQWKSRLQVLRQEQVCILVVELGVVLVLIEGQVCSLVEVEVVQLLREGQG